MRRQSVAQSYWMMAVSLSASTIVFPKKTTPPFSRSGGLQAAALKSGITPIAKTLDISTLHIFPFNGTMLTPEMIHEAIERPDVYYHLYVAVRATIEEQQRQTKTEMAFEQLVVELGCLMLDIVPGPHITFISPRHGHCSQQMVEDAVRLVAKFRQKGIQQHRVIVSILATEEGIAASRILEDRGIMTNLVGVCGIMHASGCVQAKASACTIPVEHILKWFEMNRKSRRDRLEEHEGLEEIQAGIEYLKIHHPKCKIVVEGYQTLSELTRLRGFHNVGLENNRVEEFKYTGLRLANPPPESRFRAKQARMPITSSRFVFQQYMTPTTRLLVGSVLQNSFLAQKRAMDEALGAVGAELKVQVDLRFGSFNEPDAPTVSQTPPLTPKRQRVILRTKVPFNAKEPEKQAPDSIIELTEFDGDLNAECF